MSYYFQIWVVDFGLFLDNQKKGFYRTVISLFDEKDLNHFYIRINVVGIY